MIHSGPDIPRRSLAAILAGLLALVGLLVVLRWHETPVGSITDDALYVEMARSIATGHGPVLLIGPDAPPCDPDTFPPGFPALLSPLAAVAPEALAPLKLVPLLAAVVLAWLSWRLPGGGVSVRRRLILAALVALNPWVVAWSVRVLSDLPFAAVSLGTALAYLAWRRLPGRGVGAGLVLGALAAAALLIRAVGVVLLVIMAADMLRGRRWRLLTGVATATLVVTALPLAAGWPLDFLSGGYREQLLAHHTGPGPRLAFMLSNAAGYLRELPTVLVPVFGNPVHAGLEAVGVGSWYGPVQWLAGLVLLAVVLTGIGAELGATQADARVRARFFGVYLLGYGAALLNFAGYPSGVQARLLLPVLPVLYGFLISGAVTLSRLLQLRGPLLTTVAGTLILCASLAHNAWRVAHPLRTATEATGHGLVDPAAGTRWLRARTRHGDVVLAQAPLERHIHLNRPVVAAGDSLTGPALRRRCDAYGVAWVLVGPVVHGPPRRLDAAGRRLQAVMEEAAWAQPAHSDPEQAVWIYRIAR